MSLQRSRCAVRENRHAVLLTLAVAHHDLRVLEVDVLHAQSQRLHEAQPAAVQQLRDQVKRRLELREQRLHLSPRQNDRHVLRRAGANDVLEPRQLDLEYVAVQEQDRRQRLVLRRGRNPPFDREVRQEALDLGRRHLASDGACR